jgi:hypothetical protein
MGGINACLLALLLLSATISDAVFGSSQLAKRLGLGTTSERACR